MGFQCFCGKGPHRVLWTGSWAARGKITVSCVPDCVCCAPDCVSCAPDCVNCAPEFSPISTIPPTLHTHSFTYHPHYRMFLSQYFSFPLSLSFHHCSIHIHSFIHSSPTDCCCPCHVLSILSIYCVFCRPYVHSLWTLNKLPNGRDAVECSKRVINIYVSIQYTATVDITNALAQIFVP